MLTPSNEPNADAEARGTPRWVKVLAAPLVILSAVLGLGFAKWCRTACYEPPPTTPPRATSLQLPKQFCQNWPKPDCVLLLSGQMHGYVLPCGCSVNQYGGLERRYNLIQVLKDRGWEVVAVDVGDLTQMKGPAGLPNIQGPLKYVYTMKALQAMDYTAVGLGEYEAALSWSKLLGDFALNEPKPRVVVANLSNSQIEYPEETRTSQTAATKAGLNVGVTSLIGPIVEDRIKERDRTPKFGPNTEAAVKAALAGMAKDKADLRVLLYQGYAATPNARKGLQPEAVECAKAFPQFQVLLCLDEADEPPLNPLWVEHGDGKPKTLVARVGHKGKYVAVVGVYKTGDPAAPFTFRYQSVDLSEEFKTPKAEEANQPILRLMEEYTKELKDKNYLARYGQMKHAFEVAVAGSQPKYVGSKACADCHVEAYKKWETTKHAHAYQTLVEKAKQPSNREYDAECIVCHTVGFGYKTGFKDAKTTAKLENVGCESCHGPASEHVKNPQNAQWLALMNPWKAKKNETPAEKEKRVGLMDQMCQRCHDSDNDNTYTHQGFERKWPSIQHYDDEKKNWPPYKEVGHK